MKLFRGLPVLVLLAAACGDPSGFKLQGSGATGKLVSPETPAAPVATAGAGLDAPQPKTDRLSYFVSYDGRSRELHYQAWNSGHDPLPGTALPGVLTADGVRLEEDRRLGVIHVLDRRDVAPFETLATTVRWEHGAQPFEETVSLTGIAIDTLGELSASRGISVAWNGPALRTGEQLSVRLRRPGSPYVWDHEIWGQVGMTNTPLWIDGQALRVAPNWTRDVVPGATYEVWVSRKTMADQDPAPLYSLEYESAALTVTAVP